MHHRIENVRDRIKTAFKGISTSTLIIRGLITALVILIIFWAGMAVGYRKAMFSFYWHSHYAEQFAGNRSPLALPNDGDADNMPNPHGAFGKIDSLQLPLFIIKGPVEAEKTVVVTDKTVVRNMHQNTSSSSIAVGQNVVVLGDPDENGRIVASFIRILPTLTSSTSSNK